MEAIVNNNGKSLSQLAFAISPPGTAPNDGAFKEFFPGQVGVTLEITKKDDVSTHIFLPAAEHDQEREQQGLLQCLSLRGDDECLHKRK